MTEVVVVGGGIVGSGAAYRLARSGAEVTLVDRADSGQATAAGAGIISPGTGFGADSPIYPLAREAIAYYPEFLAQLSDDGEEETGYEVVGALLAATSGEESSYLPDALRSAEDGRRAGFRNIGEATMLDGGEARELFPALGENVRGAVYMPEAARIDGRLLRDALQRAARKRGANIVRGDARLAVRYGRVVGVEVDRREVSAGAVILAAGAWTNALCEGLGLEVPVYPQRGQILHLSMPGTDTTRWPVVLGFRSHYLLAFPTDRIVAGATREHGSGYDPRVTAEGAREALSEALRVAPGLADATLREVRVGLRPASPDGLPVLGRAPGVENVYLATGHGPSGLQLGPYSGALVADLTRGEPAPFSLEPFAAERFVSE